VPLEPPQIPVPFPSPLITEVLYAVPTVKSAKGEMSLCDANKDGVRDAVGDEFIGLVNPHDRPIKLGGYKLSDQPRANAAQGKKPGAELLFAFPPLELGPGETVVVFNGNKQTWTGPVGDSTKAAPRNDRFHNAYVFSMRVKSSRRGLANGGDWVLLTAPDGRAVQCVTWGEVEGRPDRGALVEEAPLTDSGSVQRDGISGGFVSHRSLGAPHEGRPFSPGHFEPAPAVPGAKTATPEPSKPPK
jgi:hypothetical protein